MIKKIEIFNRDTYELLDICFAYSSIKVVRKFRGIGSIAIVLDSINEGIKFNIGNYILFEGETYLVESVHYYKNGLGVVKVEVNGRHINQILAERVLLPNFAENTEEIAELYKIASGEKYSSIAIRMVQECFTNLTAPYNTGEWNDRVVPMEFVANGDSLATNSEYTIKAPILLSEALNNVLSNKKLGYKVVVDYERKKHIFNVYEPQTKEVYFSEIFGNVSDADFYQMNTDEKTTSIYADKENLIYKCEGSGTGFNRKELLNDNGSNELNNKNKSKTNASFDALSTDTFKYKVDFDLGDIVYYDSPSFKINTQQQITEVTEQYDTIETIAIVIGDFIPTIYDKLKGEY